ncbi:MAG TPA: dipeptidase [Myxococcota bacterium]|nr:dipeptidase [Myxococcota bacterium]
MHKGTPFAVAAACLLAACSRVPGESPDARALRVHRDALVLDTHADTTPRFQDPDFDFAARHDESDVRIDLPRAREGGLDVQFWSIYVGKVDGDGRAIREALERIDAVWELARRHPDDVVVATDVAGIRRGVAEGKFVSLMGMEGGHMIENKLSVLRDFYRLGVRYMTLTHSFHIDWADSAGMNATPLPPSHGGLTPFGVEVVHEMNRLGMMVDVSHVSDGTFWDALKASQAPVIASHSSCRAIYDHPRNLSDDMLRALAAKGGVVMINYYPGYTDPVAAPKIADWFARHGPEFTALREKYAGDLRGMAQAMRAIAAADPVPRGSLDALLDHFDHALRVAGEDHVGLGSDFDGVASFPIGLGDASQLPNLTKGLLARGWSEEVVRKVLGENLLRTMREVELVAERLRSQPAAPPTPR